jgi:hypothetical protein
MENKQTAEKLTAMQELIRQLELNQESYLNAGMYVNAQCNMTAIRIANELILMEKEQIMDAHIKGHYAPSSTLKYHDAEQYYNETYNKQDSEA